MNFLVLLSIFASVSASFTTQIFKDPRSFVSTFENADPKAINKVIEIVNSMVDQNNAQEATAINDYNSAKDIAAKSLEQLNVAQADLKKKLGDRDLSLEKYNEAVETRKLKLSQRDAANGVLNKAQTDLDEKTAFLAAEDKRIKGEEVVLRKVLAILGSLNGGGRRLLSFSPEAFLATLSAKGLKVNPDSLQSVVDSVNKLIAEGNRLLAEANQAVEDATSVRNKADAAHKHAVACLEKAVTAEENAHSLYIDYKKEAEAAQKVFDAVETQHNKDVVARNKLHDFMTKEITRVKQENTDLAEVKRLLVALL